MFTADKFKFPSQPAHDEAVGAVVTDVLFVPPFAMGSVPVTPVVRGNPVQLVRTPELGVPKAGVTKEGEVAKTTLPEPVVEVELAAVTNPLAFTVILASVNEPTFEFTVARVNVALPGPDAVPSPVSAVM